NIERARFIGDNDVALKEELRRALTLSHRHGTTRAAPPSFLAISGGGVEGAFGAGLLVGWSEHGDRPQFSIVTGTSAGALVAPFVFLGPTLTVAAPIRCTPRAPTVEFARVFIAGPRFGEKM